jgi:hypothetical protein
MRANLCFRRIGGATHFYLAFETLISIPFFTKLRSTEHEMKTINLKERFGDRYRVTFEESYFAERGKEARADDPWLQILLCRHGHISPCGGNILMTSTNKHGAVANQLAALRCVQVIQDGDDGINAIFCVDDFDTVAALMKPRRRRQVSERERERLGNLGRENLNRYRQANFKLPENDAESPPSGRPDLAAA